MTCLLKLSLTYKEGTNMEETKSKVYVLLDSQNRITRCEGQYTLSNIQNIDEWTLIEEGTPCDRLNLAQSHYFSGGLYTTDGVCRYKYVDGQCILRTDAEIEADRAAIPTPVVPPTNEELQTQLTETQATLESTQEMLDAILMGEITL